MARLVRPLRGEELDRAQVVGDEAVEAPLPAQHVGEQPAVHRRRHAVDGVVGRHHRLRLALDEGGLPVREPVVVQVALVDDRRQVLPARLDVVDREVLHGGGDLQVGDVLALQAADVGHRHAAGQVRILAEDLLDASPARVAADVDDGRPVDQAVRRAGPVLAGVVERPRLVGHRVGDLVHQVRIPRRAHRRRHREQRRRLLRPHAVQRLVPAAPPLDAEPRQALVQVIELLRLLLDRQAADEVADPRLDRLRGVAVERRVAGLAEDQRGGAHDGQRQERARVFA